MIKTGQLAGLRVLVVGAAREGTAAAHYLAAHGAHVRLADAKPRKALGPSLDSLQAVGVALECEVANPLLQDLDVVVLSPGVPPQAPVVQAARQRGLPLTSEPRLFTQLYTGLIVGVTGSSGKTTTTSLLGEMFRQAGRPVLVGGNIGTPLISTLDGEARRAQVAVIELSSFQLELFAPDYQGAGVAAERTPASRPIALDGWSPPIAVVTNITPNHLDRHPSMEAYVQAKRNILAYQQETDWAVLNADDPRSSELAPRGNLATFSLQQQVAQGAYLRGNELVCRWGDHESVVCHREEVVLRGMHNVANALAACVAAAVAGVAPEAMRAAITRFAGEPHRLEVVSKRQGVTWVNDSIATSPERVVAALKSFDEPLVLLAGGRDKHLPWDEWARWVARRVRLVIAFGECAPLVADTVHSLGRAAPELVQMPSLTEAVAEAAERARAGDVVLLSPGGTSFDAFSDFEERGDAFRCLVRGLK